MGDICQDDSETLDQRLEKPVSGLKTKQQQNDEKEAEAPVTSDTVDSKCPT